MSFSGNIRTAREIGQSSRIARSDECWYSKYFVRYFSIYISYALANLRIPANVVTVLTGVVGLCGSTCMIFHSLWWNVAGAILWQIWFILDCVDGEVARLQNRASVLGIYLDRVSHIVANSTFVLALGLHVYFLKPSILNLIVSIALYSAWHWKREIPHLVNTTLVVEAGFRKGEFVIKRKKSVALVRHILGSFFGEVEVMLIVTALIMLSHKLGVGFAKWGLYVYTVLVLAYVGMTILRHVRQISSKENI